MRCKRMITLSGVAALALIVCGTAAYWALWQEPDFYAQAMQVPADPVAQKQQAKQFVQRTLRLVDDIRHANHWSEHFSQEQVNSWLAEELHHKYADLVPRGVNDPRVQFVPDTVQIGFRYQRGDWQGIVSLNVKPCVPQDNQLALEIQSVRAGLLPIPLDSVIEKVLKGFRKRGWSVKWKQANGNDVLLIDIDRSAAEPPRLQSVQVTQHGLRISGERNAAGSDYSDLRSQLSWKQNDQTSHR
jgi:hypothetical protein